MRFPSNGISPISDQRSSVSMVLQQASAVSLSGQRIQEKTTTSPYSSFTAMGKEVSLPSGTMSPQFSIMDSAP